MNKRKIPLLVKIIGVVLLILVVWAGIAHYNKGFSPMDKVANFFDDLIPDKPREENDVISGTDQPQETDFADIVSWTENY